MEEVKNHWKKWLYWFILAIAIIAVYKALDNFTDIIEGLNKFFSVIGPFLAGIFISYVLYMPCKDTEKAYRKSKNKLLQKRARGLSIITVYFIVITVILIFINVIMPIVVESISDFVPNIPIYYESAINYYNNLPEDSIFKADVVKEQIDNIKNIDIKQYFSLDKILEYAAGAINIVTGVFDIFVALIVSIYVLLEKEKILQFLKKLANAMFKERTYKNVDKIFNNSNKIFFKFIASQFVDAIVVGIMATIALTIMKVKYAPLLGFFIGISNMIPYFGAIAGIGVSAILTLITGGISQAIWMLIITVILQQADANIINPRIVGNSLKLSPLLIILSVMIGGAYFGVIGMFLAVPVTAVLKIIVEDYVNLKIEAKKDLDSSIDN